MGHLIEETQKHLHLEIRVFVIDYPVEIVHEHFEIHGTTILGLRIPKIASSYCMTHLLANVEH